MLSNRTPPTCIQANIYAMARVLHPEMDVVKELPSVMHIKDMRTVLLQCTKSLAAYTLGRAKIWNQLHTDDTARHQCSIVNVVILILESDNQLKTKYLHVGVNHTSGWYGGRAKQGHHWFIP
jgi:hypothetical protein